MLARIAIKYALHGFVLHGLQAVRGLTPRTPHGPVALMGAPTLLSALLIDFLVSLSMGAVMGPTARRCWLEREAVAPQPSAPNGGADGEPRD
ncbi:hypothetical protein [Hydrogenophaga sp. PAMC20947]|uniref:hypothetical protein n=1 Tax=Hydrogenophaga sp. PAMC20947 TaxID=2565558 RepID=UPI00109DD729|nr:hypothetical protein [Hydrogenophaga sp. PAMC20947]QCB45571.1 hypothetical protein E5678_05760 [Hydrogenophaga sp. PAMC20947]